jgi:hypothetical protein
LAGRELAALLFTAGTVLFVAGFPVMAAVEVAAAVVIVLALLWPSRGKNPNPMLDRLIESPSSAILISHQELGGGRHVLRTGAR